MTNIRLASTVILLRENTKSNTYPCPYPLQIYTIKRPETMRFLPGYTAFPGGAIEQQDQTAEWQNYIYNTINTHILLSEHTDYPKRGFSESQITGTILLETANVIAAIREVFEETGILICLPKIDTREGNHASLQPIDLQPYRQAILAKEITFLDMIKSLRIKLNVGKLLYIGRRLTPPSNPIRFDTNFYVTILPTNVTSIPFKREIAADAWMEPMNALNLWERQEILCAPPTIECMKALHNLSDPMHVFGHLR